MDNNFNNENIGHDACSGGSGKPQDAAFPKDDKPFEIFLVTEYAPKPRKKASRRFKTAVAMLLILTFIGMPLMGAGIGAGVQLANSYFLPRLLNDAAQRENFAFDNVHTPLRVSELPLLQRQNYVDLVNLVKPSVVTLTVEVEVGSGLFGGRHTSQRAGTGILMYETSSRYYVATNAHVIEGGQAVFVSIDGSPKIPAIPIGRDDDADLGVVAIYKAEAVQAGVYSVNLARFGDSYQAQVGEIVLAIGNAMGEGISVTNGIISALDITIFVEGRILDVIQTNAAINRGNSGGPLVNVFGEVIGINTAKFDEQLAEGMGYAIPSHVAKPILERIMQDGPTPRRPRIGINFQENQHGVVVDSVGLGSPAHEAGMQRGDIIIAVDGAPIPSGNALISHMETRNQGETAIFTVIRGGQQVQLSVILGPYLVETF